MEWDAPEHSLRIINMVPLRLYFNPTVYSIRVAIIITTTTNTSTMGRSPTRHAKLSFPSMTGVLVECYVINVL